MSQSWTRDARTHAHIHKRTPMDLQATLPLQRNACCSCRLLLQGPPKGRDVLSKDGRARLFPLCKIFVKHSTLKSTVWRKLHLNQETRVCVCMQCVRNNKFPPMFLFVSKSVGLNQFLYLKLLVSEPQCCTPHVVYILVLVNLCLRSRIVCIHHVLGMDVFLAVDNVENVCCRCREMKLFFFLYLKKFMSNWILYFAFIWNWNPLSISWFINQTVFKR